MIRAILLTQPGTYDLGQIHTIINTTSVLHVSFQPSPEDQFPGLLPMIGVMGSYEYPSSDINEPQDCYLHGYVSARMMRLARDSGKGLAVSIAATKVDGIVLSLTPNSHSYNYRSAVLQGYGKPVEDTAEKLYAMELITNKVMPERWQNSRTPPDGAEMSSTTILRVTIETGSGKIRQGEPHDEKKDLDRADVTDHVWTGVMPAYEAFGEPISSATNKVTSVPSYLAKHASTTTSNNHKKALEMAKEP